MLKKNLQIGIFSGNLFKCVLFACLLTKTKGTIGSLIQFCCCFDSEPLIFTGQRDRRKH
eukprot:c17383_g1_i1 orf=372-548(+)